MKKVARKIECALNLMYFAPAQYRLARLKSRQKKAFIDIANQFSEKYKKVKGCALQPFVVPLWEKFNAQLESSLLPTPPFGFLREKTIVSTMFINSGGKLMQEELLFIKNVFSEAILKKILIEDLAGRPYLINNHYLTSHNTIHHAYHIARFLKTTGTEPTKFKTIVEWGGGYGNFAKILKRVIEKPVTYIIIDIPLLSCLQWVYLSTLFGKDAVNFATDPGHEIVTGKINLLPACFLHNLKVEADLFVSTWALSESSAYAQQYVFEKKWFGAKNLLLAYQDSNTSLPDASLLDQLAVRAGTKKEEIPYLPKNHYAFL